MKVLTTAALALLAWPIQAATFNGFYVRGTAVINSVDQTPVLDENGEPVFTTNPYTVGDIVIFSAKFDFGQALSTEGNFVQNVPIGFDNSSFVNVSGYGTLSSGIFENGSEIYATAYVSDGQLTGYSIDYLLSDVCGTVLSASDSEIFSTDCRAYVYSVPIFSYNATMTIDRVVQFGVPEPASWALMLIGFAAVGTAVRRRDAPGNYSLRSVSAF